MFFQYSLPVVFLVAVSWPFAPEVAVSTEVLKVESVDPATVAGYVQGLCSLGSQMLAVPE